MTICLLLLFAGCTRKPSDATVREAARRRFFYDSGIIFCHDEGISNQPPYPVKFNIRAAGPDDAEVYRLGAFTVFNTYTQTRDSEVFYVFHFDADYSGIPKRDLALMDEVFDGGTNDFYISMLGRPPIQGQCICSDTGTFSLVYRGNSWYGDSGWFVPDRD